MSNITCCIWTDNDLTNKKLSKLLECIDVITQESHSSRKILKCRECGQLYLYVFEEEVDWDKGNDEQLFRWIPVENIDQAIDLSKKSVFRLLSQPSIRIDFSKEMTQPKGPYKIDFSS